MEKNKNIIGLIPNLKQSSQTVDLKKTEDNFLMSTQVNLANSVQVGMPNKVNESQIIISLKSPAVNKVRLLKTKNELETTSTSPIKN